MTTLYEKVTGWMQDQQYKHDLGSDYVERTVNKMSQHEFLTALSEAFEALKEESKDDEDEDEDARE